MKLTDIVTEQQLDELDIAGGLAKGIGAVSKGVGAVGGAAAGVVDAAKSGWAAGRAAVGGYKAPQDAGIDGTLNVQQLAKLMPGIDAAALAKAVSVVRAGGEPSVSQQQALSSAFIGLLQADPQATTQAMSLLKKVSSEPAQEKPAAQNAAATKEPAASQATTGKTDATQASAPQTPDQIRAAKQADAAKAAQDQMAANPSAPKPDATQAAATQTPDQIRAAKQADAAKAAQDQMAANPSAPKPDATQAAATPTPDQVRATKQADAAKAAQDQMAANPSAPKPAADPGAGAFGQMANTLTKEPTTTATPQGTTPPAGQTGADKMTPQQIAALKGRLKAGAGATSGKSGFSQYTKDASGQRIVGANKDGSVRTVDIKASKINTGNNLSEMLAANIAKQKKKIAEARTANYENSSIFTK